MKHCKRIIAVLVFCFFMMNSCASFMPDLSLSRSWSLTESKNAGSVWISPVVVDKASDRESVKEEASVLLLLILKENHYAQAFSPEAADLFVEVNLREREYNQGWNIERSLSAEVCFRGGPGETGPIRSAGRVIKQGGKSFSSSEVLGTMLEEAVKQAIEALAKS